MKRRAIRSILLDDEGSIAVEFIVTLPLILAAMFFVYEFGRALWGYEVVSQDLRTSIRYLSRASSDNGTPPAPQSAFITDAENLAQTGDVTKTCPSACRYPWTASDQITVTTASGCRDGSGNLIYSQDCSVITMTASVPMTLGFLAIFNGQTAYTISVTDTAQFIGD